jgi:hypothetical protein
MEKFIQKMSFEDYYYVVIENLAESAIDYETRNLIQEDLNEIIYSFYYKNFPAETAVRVIEIIMRQLRKYLK